MSIFLNIRNQICIQVKRMTLSRLNVAQLQLIQNEYLSQVTKMTFWLHILIMEEEKNNLILQIKTLNEELVDLLVIKDDLMVGQDAILTDIEDLSQFVKIEKPKQSNHKSSCSKSDK